MLLRRLTILQSILLTCVLLLVARLMEIQILRGEEYANLARSQHYGGVVLPAKRGDILSRNSRTGELSILATNTTLDMVYIDPLATDDPDHAAVFLSETLLTEDVDFRCREGEPTCPRKLRAYYAPLFDIAERFASVGEQPPIPPREEIQRRWASHIADQARGKDVDFVPLLYSATIPQIQAVSTLGIPGIFVNRDSKLIYADPMAIPDHERLRVARLLAPLLDVDRNVLAEKLRRRHLRYVPVFHQLTPDQSDAISEAVRASAERTEEERRGYRRRGRYDLAEKVVDPLRGIALLKEHWRFYPDATLASHVVGFLNVNGEPQYGIERTFDHILRGEEGRIQAITDPFGGEIRVGGGETMIQAKDGDTVILTIDRFIQKRVEELLARRVQEMEADSGQAIVLDPKTGKILAMANSPLFDSNNYGSVYAVTPIDISPEEQRRIVVEIYHPEKRSLVVRAYLSDLQGDGWQGLSAALRQKLSDLSALYDIEGLKRYYLYLGQNSRREIFPLHQSLGSGAGQAPFGTGSLPAQWLMYENGIGVGAYLNRSVLEIYEPGSVFKPITMAVAIDHAEVTPYDTFVDKGPVQIDEYTIRNALNIYYGEVNLVQCLQFSINTCMVHVSGKLGKKLFEQAIRRFGFGRLTGVELEDELPGYVLPWKRWSNALLATAAYGQGISATPLQVLTAFAAIANGGRLMKPTIIDSIIRNDGRVEASQPRVVDQVITEETAATVTAMLVAAVRDGYGRHAGVPGYVIAGKTGTSQIAGPGGRYETGTGSTLASFAGYAPASDPKFAAIVKIDRPRKPGYEHGAQAAAPVFRDIAKFLFEYYGIPPEEGS